MKFYTKILFITSTILSTTCTNEQKLIKKIEHNAKIVYDTIYIKDTFYTKQIKYDTSITFFNKKIDSINIKINYAKNPIYLNLKKIYDTLKINLNIPQDTIIKQKEIAYQKFILETQSKYEKTFKNFAYLLIGIIILLILLIIYTLSKLKI
jgi:hypothetical protein